MKIDCLKISGLFRELLHFQQAMDFHLNKVNQDPKHLRNIEGNILNWRRDIKNLFNQIYEYLPYHFLFPAESLDDDYASINSINFTPDMKYLVRSNEMNSIKIIDLETYDSKNINFAHYRTTCSCHLSKDGKKIISGGGGGNLMVDNIENPFGENDLMKFDSSFGLLTSTEFSPDMKYFVVGFENNHIEVVDIKTEDSIISTTIAQSPETRISRVQFTPDMNYLISQHTPNEAINESIVGICIHDTSDINKPILIDAILINTSQFDNYDLSPDSRYLAWADCQKIRIYELATRKISDIFLPHRSTNEYISAAFSPDGHYVAAAIDNKIHIFHLASRRLVNEFTSIYQQKINLIKFAPDGKTLVAADIGDKEKEIYSHLNFWTRE